jgi:hypothetical protein
MLGWVVIACGSASSAVGCVGCDAGGGNGDGGSNPDGDVPVGGACPGTDAPPGPGGAVTYVVDGKILRVSAEAGATPVELGAAGDSAPAVSRNGDWITVSSTRTSPDCAGWSCVAESDNDLASPETILSGGDVIHAAGRTAVSCDGQTLVYPEDRAGPNAIDLFVVRKSGSTWSSPKLLTGDSPHAFNELPVLSSDAEHVLFDCGPTEYGQRGSGICEVGIDGSGFHRIIDPAKDSPLGNGSSNNAAHHADYAPDGSIVFEADWEAEQIWRRAPNGEITRPMPSQSNDNTPCVLPGGYIASLWLGRPGTAGLHELKVMAPDGSSFEVVTPNVDVEDIGMSCHR